MKNIHEVLEKKEGKNICIAGIIRVEPHGVYFPTIDGNEAGLYGGNIYIPLRFADALRSGLKGGDQHKYEGVLRISKSSNCSEDECSVYYLD